ncbi:hypothetical protein I4U23_001891 [Adineta vaga]|nr:hypothetical protein I4U23_001891 [Adineta vaga]
MATDQSSPESTSQKRQRRLKQDPQFVFEHTTTTPTTDPIPIVKKQKTKSVSITNEDTSDANLYQPGDVVWSKLGSFPWWPALIYRSDADGGTHTRTLNSNNKSKRQFFVYFYGKYLEYAWLSTRSLLKYAGLNDFIQHAEAAVQQVATKSEQVELANRYQLKVSVKKRVQWDEAIELADHALTMTKDERIQEFKDLLNDVQTKNNNRRRKIVINKIGQARQYEKDTMETDTERQEDEEQVTKNKSDRKSDIKNNDKHSPSVNSNTNQHTNNNEVEYEYPISSNNQSFSYPLNHFIQANIPPLSNYEQKQIVEGLLHHPNEQNITLDEAQKFANEKAMEIVYENYYRRMDSISSEWFYDSILLKYPSIVFKYRSWFTNIELNTIPNETDALQLKQWQIALMIQARIKSEQHQSQSINNT